jgi:hypothetical protein
MKLSAPKNITWIIAVILAVVALLAMIFPISFISHTVAFWVLMVGFVLLAIANFVKGL